MVENAPDAIYGEIMVCESCGASFAPKRQWQKFCSTPCRRRKHRIETRIAILAGMVTTAKALGYSREDFLETIGTLWDKE